MNDCFIGCFFVPNFASQSNQKRVEIAVIIDLLHNGIQEMEIVSE